MSETAEKLFFRYQPGDCHSYSLATLLSLTQYLPRFGPFIYKKPQSFIRFLTEVPLSILSFYAKSLHMLPEFIPALTDPSVVNRLRHFHSSTVTSQFVHLLNCLDQVDSLHILHDDAIAVTFKKPFSEQSFFDSDLLVTVSSAGISLLPLINKGSSRKENQIYIQEALQSISLAAEGFKQKHRLQMCFL